MSYTHTTRATGTILTALIYNTDHQNHIDHNVPADVDDYSANASQMQAVTSPGGVGTESLATSLAGELERLRFVLKAIHGGAQWYDIVAAGAAGLVPISGGSFSGVASKQFNDIASSSYKAFLLILRNIKPASDNTALQLKFLKNTTPVTGSLHYGHGFSANSAGGLVAASDTAQDALPLMSGAGTGAGETVSGFALIVLPIDILNAPTGVSLMVSKNENGAVRLYGRALLLNEGTPTVDVDGFEISQSSGNISGDWTLIGVR